MPKLKPGQMYCYPGNYNGSLGVLARVPGSRGKFFAYSKYGKEGAMEACIAYVTGRIDRKRVNPDTGRHVRKRAGIFRIVRRQTIRKKVYVSARWVAQWQERSSVNKRREFSVKKYGEAGAKRAAREHRAKMVARILGLKCLCD